MLVGLSVAIALAIGALLAAAALIARHQSGSFRVPARLDQVRPLVARIVSKARQAHLDEQAIHHCRLALDEACCNIIEHSYAGFPEGEIEVIVDVRDGECAIHLVDFGHPYNPEMVPSPEIGASIDNLRPGGLGLYLMRQVMDEVSYTPSPRGNRLTMIKRR